MADTSDVVLMDLRGFSEEKKGCRYEINYLIDSGMARQAILVTDKTTNVAFLDRMLLNKARSLAIDSSSTDRDLGMTLIHMDNNNSEEVDSVFAALSKCAEKN